MPFTRMHSLRYICCALLIWGSCGIIAQEQKEQKDEFAEWVKSQQDPEKRAIETIARSLKKLADENEKLREDNLQLQKQMVAALQAQNQLLAVIQRQQKEIAEQISQSTKGVRQSNRLLWQLVADQQHDNDLDKWEYHVVFNLRGDRREILIDGRSHYFFFLVGDDTNKEELEFYRRTGWQLHQIIDVSRSGSITAIFRRRIPPLPRKK